MSTEEEPDQDPLHTLPEMQDVEVTLPSQLAQAFISMQCCTCGTVYPCPAGA